MNRRQFDSAVSLRKDHSKIHPQKRTEDRRRIEATWFGATVPTSVSFCALLWIDHGFHRLHGFGWSLFKRSVPSVSSVVQEYVLQVLVVPCFVVLDANWTQLGRKQFAFCVQKQVVTPQELNCL